MKMLMEKVEVVECEEERKGDRQGSKEVVEGEGGGGV